MPDWKSFADLPTGKVLASIPDISTFNAAISGGMNPAVNIVPVLDNGPYVIFAPTNDAFAAMEPGKLDALKADVAALTSFDYYHAFLGLLGPDDVKGQRPTQQGAEVKVTGKGGDIKVNDTAKLVCGPIQSANARIYLIDTVLDPNSPPEAIVPTGSSTTTTTRRTFVLLTNAALWGKYPPANGSAELLSFLSASRHKTAHFCVEMGSFGGGPSRLRGTARRKN